MAIKIIQVPKTFEILLFTLFECGDLSIYSISLNENSSTNSISSQESSKEESTSQLKIESWNYKLHSQSGDYL